jgi:acetyltransferase-like isoleucine patch superfamily enzyme
VDRPNSKRGNIKKSKPDTLVVLIVLHHIRRKHMHIGKNSVISPEVVFEQPEKIFIGDNVQIKKGVVLRPETGFIYIGNNVVINHYTVIHAKGGIEIGDWCIIAPHCGIFAQNHSFESFDVPITLQQNKGSGITLVGDNWIGASSIILDGVTLGKGTVVGAGSVVTKSFGMAQVIVGNPAKVIKPRFPEDQWDFKKVERCSIALTPPEYLPYIRKRADFCIQHIDPGDYVLDVGCGEGFITSMIAERCKRIIGVDYSENAVNTARNNSPTLEYAHMSATDLPFDDGTFDKVTCLELIEHVTILQARRAIDEIYRILKPGGSIIGSTPIRMTETSSPSCYSHIHEYSETELSELLIRFQHVDIIDGNYFIGRKPLK